MILQVLLTVKDKLISHFEKAKTGCTHVIQYRNVCTPIGHHCNGNQFILIMCMCAYNLCITEN